MANTYFSSVKIKNWEKIKEENNYFLNSHWENKMKELKIGDKIILYITDKYQVIALYQIMKTAIKIDESLVIKIKPIRILEKPVNFRLYVDKLKLIKNVKKWGTYIQVPLRKLNNSDESLMLDVFN